MRIHFFFNLARKMSSLGFLGILLFIYFNLLLFLFLNNYLMSYWPSGLRCWSAKPVFSQVRILDMTLSFFSMFFNIILYYLIENSWLGTFQRFSIQLFFLNTNFMQLNFSKIFYCSWTPWIEKRSSKDFKDFLLKKFKWIEKWWT